MQPIDIQFLQKPKPIPSLPFKQIWVIDNYLPASIRDSWIDWRNGSYDWGRSNRVIRNDEMQHLYWGESIYHNIGEVRNRNSEIQEYYESYHRQNKRSSFQP